MASETLLQLWKSYLDAYADIPAAERESLLRLSVADDIVFSNPAAQGHGCADLVKHIVEFQKQFPGAHFKSIKLLGHHSQLLSEVMLFDKDGSELGSAQIFARFNEQGRLTEVTGFF